MFEVTIKILLEFEGFGVLMVDSGSQVFDIALVGAGFVGDRYIGNIFGRRSQEEDKGQNSGVGDMAGEVALVGELQHFGIQLAVDENGVLVTQQIRNTKGSGSSGMDDDGTNREMIFKEFSGDNGVFAAA